MARLFKSLLAPIVIFLTFSAGAQTQDDFQNKLTQVYTDSGDSKKLLQIAKEMYAMVKKKKDLQTYSNYYLLKQIFETRAPDTVLAKTCGEEADRIMRSMVGLNPTDTIPIGNDPNSQWYQVIYPSLFTTTNPDNANKAIAFLDRNPSLKNFNNYIYVGYAFERNNDFKRAKESYETAISLKGDEKQEYHSYSYYIGFLVRSGDYLKAEEYIKKIEKLAEEAIDVFKPSYKAEALTAKVVYYLAIGDFESYIQASEQQYESLSKMYGASNLCDPYPAIRYTVAAYAKEMLKDYTNAEKLWRKRDSAQAAWIACSNKQYPNFKQYMLSSLPVYLMKKGKASLLAKPVSYYINEMDVYYNNFSQYADMSINFMRGSQLAFLRSPQYVSIFQPILEQIRKSRNFRESTLPFSQYAYFSMRDRQLQRSSDVYDELFSLNIDWINDIVFSFGEKAFVTYYNSKLKEGYENYHSFVKIAHDKQPALFPHLTEQAYNNLLFTKSISLKGTQKRKEAFLKMNDPEITRLYDQWIDKKQQLIRQYFRSEEIPGTDTTFKPDPARLKDLQEEVNHLENELTTRAKDFKKYLKLVSPDWKSVRDKLKEGEAAIEMTRFYWKDQIYYSDSAYYAAYIITKNSQYPEVVYLPDPARDLDNKYYKQYRNNISLKLNDNDSYNRFWKPIREQLKGISKVYFSPDGIYHLINLSALKNPGSGQFLLDEMEIQYTLSGTDITTAAIPDKNVQSAVLVGRPSFKTETKTAQVPVEGDTRSFVSSFRDRNIADLPGTEEEVMAIKKEMEKDKIGVNYYLKEQASEDKMYKLHSPSILHIATHGFWSPAGENATEGYRVFNAMVNSGLLLSGVVDYYASREYRDTYDGILTAYEAQNLDLDNTSLVVLSACETSLGYMDAGEGVYGLQRAFRAAGAHHIMTSLWKVDDAATKEFMIIFYHNFLETKDTNKSFVLAQKAIKEKYPSPYYWAAFVLMGE